MGRKRGEIFEVVSRVFRLRDRYPGAELLVVDRLSATGVRRIPFERIVEVKKDHVVLDDGSVIPLHRVVGVDVGGKRFWRRGQGGVV